MKKILIMPVRNEEWILETSLSAASLWADHIIVADHNSTDTTAQILKKFQKVIVIQNNNQFHTSTIRKDLLDAARDFEGNNALFCFDADEVPTGSILGEDFWNQVAHLPVGTSIEMQWINLWRSTQQYRVDDALQSPQWKVFGWIDDRRTGYETLGVINDHAPRLPLSTVTPYRFDEPKVLHYQFTDWERMLSKQAHYRVTEWLQKDQTWLTAIKINLKYYSTKDERGLRLASVPKEWLDPYKEQGISLLVAQQEQVTWHDLAVLGYFAQYGPDNFALLDIWDVPWETKAEKSAVSLLSDVQGLGKTIGLRLVPLLAYHNWLLRAYGYLQDLSGKRREV